jgi:DNA invertase Pin-like site-specific DNA recombinase
MMTARSQKKELRRWAEAQTDPVAWYEDHFSGKTMERPSWGRLWRDCCEGKVKTIVCWRLDRLGRTAKGLIGLRDELIARGLNLISLRDTLDLSTASGTYPRPAVGLCSALSRRSRSMSRVKGSGQVFWIRKS